MAADGYVCGEIPDTRNWLVSNGLSASGIISHNAIEHIYDMNELFASIGALAARETFVWLSTGANPLRRKTANILTAHAIRVENETRERVPGHKERNALMAYKDIRREIVTQLRPELPDESVTKLVEATRGRRKDHIEEYVANYVDGSRVTLKPAHPTNTCDPLTGNWAERLMDPFALVADASNHGLSLKVMSGFWSMDGGNFIKNAMKHLSNIAISFGGTRCLFMSPYFVISGIANQQATATQ